MPNTPTTPSKDAGSRKRLTPPAKLLAAMARQCTVTIVRRTKARGLAANKPARRPKVPLPDVVTIVISSDEEEPTTPPRKVAPPQSNPVTPSPTVSGLAMSEESMDGLPITPGRNLVLATSPRYASSSAESTPSAPRNNARLDATRDEDPIFVENRSVHSAVVIPPTDTEALINFECREDLSTAVRRELQPHLRAGLAKHRPTKQYKRVVEAAGRKFRILIGRRGHIVVMPR